MGKSSAATASSSSSSAAAASAASSWWNDKMMPVLKKAASMNSKPTPETFPELPEVLIWMRFLLAVWYGTYLGMNDISSGTKALQGFNLILIVPIMYCKLYLGVSDLNGSGGADGSSGNNGTDDDSSYGGQLIFSGTINALATFMLIWIYIFTSNHEQEEMELQEIARRIAVRMASSASASSGQDDDDATTTMASSEESLLMEFDPQDAAAAAAVDDVVSSSAVEDEEPEF